MGSSFLYRMCKAFLELEGGISLISYMTVMRSLEVSRLFKARLFSYCCY